MCVADHLENRPVAVEAGLTIAEAVRLMHARKLNSLVVTDAGKTAGVVSIQDIAAAVVPSQFTANTALAKSMKKAGMFSELASELADTPVREIMRTDVCRVVRDADMLEVAADFLSGDLYAVLVVDGDEVVGVIGRSDMREALSQAFGVE